MKRLIFVFAMLFAVSPAFANADLGQTTHQFWDFTPGYVTLIPNDGYSAAPEVVDNPDPTNVVAGISPGLTWDGQTLFSSTTYIAVSLEIPNYVFLNPYKEIWVDLGTNVQIETDNVNVQAIPTDVDFDILVELAEGDYDLHIMIWPNPYLEKIGFTLWADGTGAPVTLDYIDVFTICVPEPATMALLGFGGLALLRRKK